MTSVGHGSAMTALSEIKLDAIRRELAEVDRELAGLGRVERALQHSEAMTQLRTRFETRFESLSQAHAAAASLGTISSQSEMLRRAPYVLTAKTRFQRAIVSLVEGSQLIPLAASFSDSDSDSAAPSGNAREALAQLREPPIRLEHHMIESDVLRRRRGTLVVNAEVNPRFDQSMSARLSWNSYAIAPLLSGADPVGMIHADRGSGGEIKPLDRDILWEFASVLSRLNESAELRRSLRQEREALRQFVEHVTALSVELTDAPVTFSGYVGPKVRHSPAPPVPMSGAVKAPSDDRLLLSGLLTRRELDVLRLLAEGGTNRAIADVLVLSETTVKFHVNSIRRKLHVANRAEAVARYLSLLGMPPPS